MIWIQTNDLDPAVKERKTLLGQCCWMEKSKIPVRKVGGCVMDPDTFYLDPDPENCPNLDPDPGPNLDPGYYQFEKKKF